MKPASGRSEARKRRRHLPAFVLLTLAGCTTPGRTEAASSYRCSGQRTLNVQYSRAGAVVTVNGGRSYDLARGGSGIGERFSSDDATLIIDGDLAAFAATDVLDLRGCKAWPRPQLPNAYDL